MATTTGPSARNIRAAARLLGMGDLPQRATRAALAGAIVGHLQAFARPRPGTASQTSPQDQKNHRRARVSYYLAMGFTQAAIVEALANEDPPLKIHESQVSRDAAEIREAWKLKAVEERADAVALQVAAWEARLGVLNEAWSHEMQAYARLRGASREADVELGEFGYYEPKQAIGAAHIRAAERLHAQIDAIEKQRRDLLALDAAEGTGTFREALIAKAEELGWPEDAIADVVAEAERIIAAGLA